MVSFPQVGGAVYLHMRMCVQTIMQLAITQLSRLASDSPVQALEFVNMVKMHRLLQQGTILASGSNSDGSSSGHHHDAVLATCHQAFQSIARALARMAVESTRRTMTRECIRKDHSHAIGQQNCRWLAMCRQNLTGLTEALAMLIARDGDSDCNLDIDV